MTRRVRTPPAELLSLRFGLHHPDSTVEAEPRSLRRDLKGLPGSRAGRARLTPSLGVLENWEVAGLPRLTAVDTRETEIHMLIECSQIVVF